MPNTYHDFNGTPGNLGGDLQSLEETSLLRTKTGVLGRDGDGAWGNGTRTSRSPLLVLKQLVTNFTQIVVGEDEANIVYNVWQQPAGYSNFVLNLHLNKTTLI